MEKQTFSDFIQNELPACYRINGFRLVPQAVVLNDGSGFTFIWCIQPNNFDFKFFFTKLSLAQEFAKQYQNSHSSDFWLKLWQKFRTYHYDICLRLVSKNSYLL